MNPFVNYDRVQDMAESKDIYQVQRSEWIRERANELAETWPENASDAFNPFVRGKAGALTEEVQELYAEFVDRLCVSIAEKEAERNEFLNGTFREVA